MARKPNPIRWTVTKASAEFGLDGKTIGKRLHAASVTPGDDGCYSTAQLAAALYGARERAEAQARIASAAARKAERDERIEARELVPVADVIRVADKFCSAIRQIIVNAKIPDSVKAAVLSEIEALANEDLTREPDESEAT